MRLLAAPASPWPHLARVAPHRGDSPYDWGPGLYWILGRGQSVPAQHLLLVSGTRLQVAEGREQPSLSPMTVPAVLGTETA